MHVSANRRVTAREILKGLHPLDLRNLAKDREVTTAFQAACYIHRVRARSTSAAGASGTGQWTPADQATADNVHRLLAWQRLVQVDLQVCASEPSYHVRLYVPLHHADLAHMAGRAFLPAPGDSADRHKADATVIVLPEWGEPRSILIDTEHSTGYILGSDYYGDIHGTVLRLVACQARRCGHLALHAASLEIVVRSCTAGGLTNCGLLIFGAGGAGKTTLAACDYGLDAAAGEKATIRQDDRVILHPKTGLIQGTEGQGLYVRTAGLSPDDRPALWSAVNHEDAVLENVWISPDGSIDYANDTLTPNSRAMVPLSQVAGSDGRIDVPKCTHAFFLVQDEVKPSVSRLTVPQVMHVFQQAEATDASCPADDQAERARAFQDFLLSHPDVLCFALSTGPAGQDQPSRKAALAESAACIRQICREGLAR